MATATPKGGSAVQRMQARTAPVAVQKGGEVEIPLDKIRFDSTQPRQAFHHPDGQVEKEDQLALEELAETIKQQGLLQAITVERLGDGTFKVLMGERRARAHILLGKATIRATVREDAALTPDNRLLIQLIENDARKDLSDADRARTIRKLMEGLDGAPPMTQAQIAAKTGKSEGYVSRFVRFGDEELQRLWVQSGIADTVEHVYRLSILPMPLQVEIQRRASLPEEHPDHIAKPISRAQVDEMSRLAKIAKAAEKSGHSAAAPAGGHASSGASEQRQNAHAASKPGNGSGSAGGAGTTSDAVSQALTDAAAAGQGVQASTVPPSGTTGITNSVYSLPESLRANILAGANATPDAGQPAATLPSVPLRGTFAMLEELMKKLEKADSQAARNLQASITLPAPIAQRLANALAGNVVEPNAIAATIHRHMGDH